MRATRIVFCLLLLVLAVSLSRSDYPLVPFREIVHTADLIFIGTVDRQECRLNEGSKFIVTDVFFREITVLHATLNSRQAGRATIKLTHAGGTVGAIGVSVSGVPVFVTGRRYVVFMRDDGNEYLSPVVAGSQGAFGVDRDAATGQSIVLAPGGRAVTGSHGMEIELSSQRIAGRQGALSKSAQNGPGDGFFATLPVPASAGEGVRAASFLTQPEAETRPVSLEEFANVVRQHLSAPPPETRKLKMATTGAWWERQGDEMVARELPSARSAPVAPTIPPSLNQVSPYSVAKAERQEGSRPQAPGGARSTLGTVLEACGYHYLSIVMEQVATSHMTYNANQEGMWIWNQFMDLFRVTPDDGSYGAWPGNQENEFVGFITDASMYSVYGFHWDGALGMTVTHLLFAECGPILQSDVMLNAANSWTNDENYAYANTGVYIVRRVIMHELGHVWGLAGGYDEELYDYDVPTVMHAIGGVIENGWGIHRSDAYLVRRHYEDQTPIINRTDVGVESYYAQGGLLNSKAEPPDCYGDQVVTLKNVTVENMSNSDVANVRLRFFLSADRTITTGDHLLGTYWQWNVFPAESYSVADYSMIVPSTVPAGTYYIGAIVTVNGFGTDDFSQNNATSFYGTIQVLTPPTLALDVLTIDLGSRYTSSSYSSGFNITNAGQGTLTFTTSESVSWISTVSPASLSLNPGQKAAVTFTGQFPAAPGTFSTGIVVNSNGGSQTVTVSGVSVSNPPGFTRILTGPVATEHHTSVACAWGDYDGDGKEDLYIANYYGNNALYRNTGAGGFQAVTTGAPVNDGGNSNAASWGDYDNDGDLDLLVAHKSQPSRLYRNNGAGIFSVVTSGQFAAPSVDSRGCSWVDYDNDGYLDIFLANYGVCDLYKNNGDRTFTRITAGPIATAGIMGRYGAWSDVDNDGDQDLFVASYYGRNAFFSNNGNGTFTQITGGPLVTDSGYACGASWGDYDNDGLMDLVVTHTNRYRNSLFHNEGGGVFTKVTTGVIASDSLFSEGSIWLDYNNDGYLDLFVARGGPGTYSEVLYRGYGNGTFTKVVGPSGEFTDRGMSFGCAAADYDNDGDLDLVVANASDPFVNYLYANDGTANHWLKIRCVGYASNRNAIGAKVQVKARIGGSTRQQTREISGQSGSGGQNSLIAHFGLGDAILADEITVRWPSGAVQVLTSQTVDRLITIEEQAAFPPPMQVTALNGYMNQVPLVWKPPAGAAALAVKSYKLRRFSQGGALSRAVDNIFTPYYRDETTNTAETFTYAVNAVYDATESDASNTVQIQVPTSGYTIRSAGASAVPRLDGVITPGEWSGAATADVTAAGATGQVTVYVMNTANMLFLAIDDTRDLTLDSNDTFGLFVDGDGNREWPASAPSREGLFQFYQGGSARTAMNAFLGIRGTWPGSMASDGWSTPSGVLQKISAARGHVQYEASIHLHTGPLRLIPGGTIGCQVYVWDGHNGAFTGTWPQETAVKLPAFCNGNAWAYAPFSYGDVTLGASSTVGVEMTFAVTVPEGTPAADTVFVSGDFNLWDPGTATPGVDGYHHDLPMMRTAPGKWTLTLPFRKDETIEYKYTRGAWASGEKGPQGEEIANRRLTIPDTGSVRPDMVARWADITGLPGKHAEDIPREFSLGQNYPNPFNPTTAISFQLPVASQVKLAVYDLLGRELVVLVNGRKAAGSCEVSFDASGLPSGMYLYRMQSPAYVQTRKLVLTR